MKMFNADEKTKSVVPAGGGGMRKHHPDSKSNQLPFERRRQEKSAAAERTLKFFPSRLNAGGKDSRYRRSHISFDSSYQLIDRFRVASPGH